MSNGIGKVEYAKNDSFVRQIVTTSDGKKVEIPNYVGSTVTVKPLKDGTYKVTSKGVTLPDKPKAEPRVSILTEEELVSRYGKNTGKNIQIIA